MQHKTKTLAIPHDPNHQMTFRKMPGRFLRKADEERDFQVQAYFDRMGPDYRARMEAQQAAAKPEADPNAPKPPARNPVFGFDQATLVKGGVIGWTLVEADGSPTPVTETEIDELPADTLEWAATESLRYVKPELFAEYDAEAERKNG
jgi:hypothetical protein